LKKSTAQCKDHFKQDGIGYTEAHLERKEILTRAGWKIINIKYYNWYADGWLCAEDNLDFQNELNRIYTELKNTLSLN
jgi:hypothetical protein